MTHSRYNSFTEHTHTHTSYQLSTPQMLRQMSLRHRGIPVHQNIGCSQYSFANALPASRWHNYYYSAGYRKIALVVMTENSSRLNQAAVSFQGGYLWWKTEGKGWSDICWWETLLMIIASVSLTQSPASTAKHCTSLVNSIPVPKQVAFHKRRHHPPVLTTKRTQGGNFRFVLHSDGLQ